MKKLIFGQKFYMKYVICEDFKPKIAFLSKIEKKSLIEYYFWNKIVF